jgi:hypothetical protein
MLAAVLLGLSSGLMSSPRKVQLSAAASAKTSDIGMRNEETVSRSPVRGKDAARGLVKEPAAQTFRVPTPPRSAALAKQSSGLEVASASTETYVVHTTSSTTTSSTTTGDPDYKEYFSKTMCLEDNTTDWSNEGGANGNFSQGLEDCKTRCKNNPACEFISYWANDDQWCRLGSVCDHTAPSDLTTVYRLDRHKEDLLCMGPAFINSFNQGLVMMDSECRSTLHGSLASVPPSLPEKGVYCPCYLQVDETWANQNGGCYIVASDRLTFAMERADCKAHVEPWIVADKNWCRHLYAHTHQAGHEKAKVQDCLGPGVDCAGSYQEVFNGTFQLCVGDDGACAAEEYLHECPWTFLMEDLMVRHKEDADSCHAKTLEAKRSLDGLLHAAWKVQEEVQYHNSIISAENTTIRDLLSDQQSFWATYLYKENLCMEWARANWSAHVKTKMEELDILAAIADPDVRSAVNFEENEGYQEHAAEAYRDTSPDLEGYRDNGRGTQVREDRAARVAARGTLAMPGALASGASLAEVEAAGPAVGSSFLEQTAEQCAVMLGLIQKFEATRKVKVFRVTASPRQCDSDRDQLETLFQSAVVNISTAMNLANQTVFDDRSACLSDATFEYKFLVEGRGQIDEKIQAAARAIHEAQYHISVLEPRLHDVEHGAERMRTYISGLRAECTLDESVWNDLRNVQRLIQNLKECPGRNDFVLEPVTFPPPVHTPAPTPWYDRTNDAGDRLHPIF